MINSYHNLVNTLDMMDSTGKKTRVDPKWEENKKRI
jgi:hypothetical protein